MVAAVVLVLGINGLASAQDSWRLVQISDGGLYLIVAGARYQLSPEVITDDELAGYTDGGPAKLPLVTQASAAAPQWRQIAGWNRANNCNEVCVARQTEQVVIDGTPWRIKVDFLGQLDNSIYNRVASVCIDILKGNGSFEAGSCFNADASVYEPRLPAGTYFFKLTTYNVRLWNMAVEQRS
ncbi:MAG: hypothetical protein EXR58_08825 [Chloroflexi bacterium]|nr:hypothetical protein [Chloroflexota bacterium]